MSEPYVAAPPEPGKPSLLDHQMRDRYRLRHLALNTEHSCVGWIRRFVLFQNRHPLEMGRKEVTGFLSHLAFARHGARDAAEALVPALMVLLTRLLPTPAEFP